MEFREKYGFGFLIAILLFLLAIYYIVRDISLITGVILSAFAMAIITVMLIDVGFLLREWGRANPDGKGHPSNLRAIVFGAILGNAIIACLTILIIPGSSIYDVIGFGVLITVFMLSLLTIVGGYIWYIEYKNAIIDEEKENAKNTLLMLPILVVPLTLMTILSFTGIVFGNSIDTSIHVSFCFGVFSVPLISIIYILFFYLRSRVKKNKDDETSFSEIEDVPLRKE